ncbi:response regulator [Candidatus Parabeggiatoa sp. HSG14]|uniref:response regulator transcription factor n=1 Tax=Candidatus Parabeggiatoa sp. HSG14 TaxID=3055593 RepID=UPI0025A856CE|nr:response regulator [Thiotrichales bacterium HSG14]
MSVDVTRKILLIDDDEDLRNLIAIYLKMANYEIFHAVHGEDGKEQLKTLTPDLIIVDMMMPVLDGIGFLRWLQQEAKLEIPIIALTGRSKSDTQTTAQELGATKVVFKPCDPEKIVEYAKEIIG